MPGLHKQVKREIEIQSQLRYYTFSLNLPLLLLLIYY